MAGSVIGIAAYAFFANYLAEYIIVIGAVPVLYAIVLSEERELRERFGRVYAEYCRRVPRFWPRRRAATGSTR